MADALDTVGALDRLDTIAVIEDSASVARCYREYLKPLDVAVDIFERGEGSIECLASGKAAVALIDLRIADMDGLELLKVIRDKQVNTIPIVISMADSKGLLAEAMQLGAEDYLEKPFSRDRFILTIKNALEKYRFKQQAQPNTAPSSRDGFCGFVGQCEAMQSVYQTIESAASSRASVFILGESGTGKEVCAAAIHEESQRKEQPFIPINCAAIPRDLMESEIFGHAKGAFTGAHSSREGAAHKAHKGTLFLDEIGEMDMDLQSKLLRFVQTGTFQKVGSSHVEHVDVRFVCATNRDPLEQIQLGRFREDLYYRLNVIPIELPPLRERGEDILAIAKAFLEKFNREENKTFLGFDEATKQRLMTYEWPGNIRQLQNVIHNVIVLNEAEWITLALLPAPLNRRAASRPFQAEPPRTAQAQPVQSQPVQTQPVQPQPVQPQPVQFETVQPPITQPETAQYRPAEPSVAWSANNASDETVQFKWQDPADITELWEVEMQAIERAIDLCHHNISRAAQLLGISPSTIYRKRHQWEQRRVAKR